MSAGLWRAVCGLGGWPFVAASRGKRRPSHKGKSRHGRSSLAAAVQRCVVRHRSSGAAIRSYKGQENATLPQSRLFSSASILQQPPATTKLSTYLATSHAQHGRLFLARPQGPPHHLWRPRLHLPRRCHHRFGLNARLQCCACGAAWPSSKELRG